MNSPLQQIIKPVCRRQRSSSLHKSRLDYRLNYAHPRQPALLLLDQALDHELWLTVEK
jgi:hypothetical protein